MDQYTSDLLTKWGLVEYVDTFSGMVLLFLYCNPLMNIY